MAAAQKKPRIIAGEAGGAGPSLRHPRRPGGGVPPAPRRAGLGRPRRHRGGGAVGRFLPSVVACGLGVNLGALLRRYTRVVCATEVKERTEWPRRSYPGPSI